MIGDGKCQICGKIVSILNGPESYVYYKYNFYHNECFVRAKKEKLL